MATFDPVTRRGLLGEAMKLAATSLLTRHVTAAGVSAAPERPKGSEWRIGCYTRPWDKHDYRTALDAIAEAGFKYAGLLTAKSKTGLVISVGTTLEEARRVAEEDRKRELQILSVYGGDIPVDQSLQAAISALRRLIDNSAETGLSGGHRNEGSAGWSLLPFRLRLFRGLGLEPSGFLNHLLWCGPKGRCQPYQHLRGWE